MKTLPRITKILKVEPFKVTTIWNNAEVREIDFTSMFERWKKENNTLLFPLMDYEKFKDVSVLDNLTLCWKNIPVIFTFDGKTQTSPLDLDPDTLYKESRLIRKVEPLRIGFLLRKIRKKAGLTQTDVALNSGTTRNYISRIEKGETDIQLETIKRIVELGMGKKLHLQIK